MSELDLLKLMQKYEGEIEEADFTPQELKELLERMNDGGELTDGKPMTTYLPMTLTDAFSTLECSSSGIHPGIHVSTRVFR